MSISVVLVPMAIALLISVGAASGSISSKRLNKLLDESIEFETDFVDALLLKKTLTEHGLEVIMNDNNNLVCYVDVVTLSYKRQNESEPFTVTVNGVKDADSFIEELECFEREYKQNVQSYTYNKLMDNLDSHNMSVANEEILEDNSIVITLDINQ